MRKKMLNGTKKIVPILVLGAFVTFSAGCAGPKFNEATADPNWDTSYKDALSPHTQLALGIMETVREQPARVSQQAQLKRQWAELVDALERDASTEEINSIRRSIESTLDPSVVEAIKSRRYSRSDLMSFMLGSGMSIPAGGPSSIDPDKMAAKQTVRWLSGEAQQQAADDARTYTPVPPAQALSPVENLTLGTVTLLAEDRESFDMSQVFRLALYFRPLRRIYDPNPDLKKTVDQKQSEIVYMDRIWRVLTPDQVKKIRAMNLTRSDLDRYIKEHGALPGLDPNDNDPIFTVLEYAVNDFHEQIAPQTTISASEKGEFFVPSTLQQLSGLEPGHGKRLYEGICSSCHGVDGQGRFPPITMQSYLKLHSDHEHAAIVMQGPPQKPDAPVVMPTFSQYLTEDQIWSIVRYVRSFETRNLSGEALRRGESEARSAGVRFYDTPEILDAWQNKDRMFLDIQSDIAYRIMGHIPESNHYRPSELFEKIGDLPKDEEIVVIDMFGSQGLEPATRLAKLGYKVGYMNAGMMDWHIVRNYPVAYD